MRHLTKMLQETALDPDAPVTKMLMCHIQGTPIEWPGGTVAIDETWRGELAYPVTLPGLDKPAQMSVPIEATTEKLHDDVYVYDRRILSWERIRGHTRKPSVLLSDGRRIDDFGTTHNYTHFQITNAHFRALCRSVPTNLAAFNLWAAETKLARMLVLARTLESYSGIVMFRDSLRSMIDAQGPHMELCRSVLLSDDPETLYAANVRQVLKNPASRPFIQPTPVRDETTA